MTNEIIDKVKIKKYGESVAVFQKMENDFHWYVFDKNDKLQGSGSGSTLKYVMDSARRKAKQINLKE